MNTRRNTQYGNNTCITRRLLYGQLGACGSWAPSFLASALRLCHRRFHKCHNLIGVTHSSLLSDDTGRHQLLLDSEELLADGLVEFECDHSAEIRGDFGASPLEDAQSAQPSIRRNPTDKSGLCILVRQRTSSPMVDYQ